MAKEYFVRGAEEYMSDAEELIQDNWDGGPFEQAYANALNSIAASLACIAKVLSESYPIRVKVDEEPYREDDE